ncbi:MAG: Uma2 family endonuclease [Lachnospiraceae bacterium]|nr:Uma2 family endonuclease [Lachnospiraceae bacterium]
MKELSNTSYGQKAAEDFEICEPSAAYVTGDYQQDFYRMGIYREGLCDVNYPRQGSYTIEDYYAMPDDKRIELIDGFIYDMAASGQLHQEILGRIYHQILPCVDAHPECEVFIAPADVRLDNSNWTMVQPDLFIVCNRKDDDFQRFNGAPDFIIEIVSPSSRYHDMFRKLNKYRLARVKEYWIIDPQRLKITVYDFEHEELPMTHTFDETIQIGISKGRCKVDFAAIYDKVKKYLAIEN